MENRGISPLYPSLQVLLLNKKLREYSKLYPIIDFDIRIYKTLPKKLLLEYKPNETLEAQHDQIYYN